MNRKIARNGVAGFLLTLCFVANSYSQIKYEGKPIESLSITLLGNDNDQSAAEQFRLIASNAIGDVYSSVTIRNALEELYATNRIVSANVVVKNEIAEKLAMTINIRRKTIAKKITIELAEDVDSKVSESDLLLNLNLFNPGDTISERDLDSGSSQILTYLRELGFYEARVTHKTVMLDSDIDVEVIYLVNPGEQTRVSSFKIEIEDYDPQPVKEEIELKDGAPYSQEALQKDVKTIRDSLQSEAYLAPQIDEPRLVYDGDENLMEISLTGEAGAKVDVIVDSGDKEKLKEKTEVNLLPVLREGTIDYGAIVEGERRLENYYQERGYFFAEVTPYCSVSPPFKPDEASETENDTEVLCTALSGADLSDREVEIKYDVFLNRRLKLTDIRIEGDTILTMDEVGSVLDSKEANPLGIVPFLGYGRGFTSTDLLQKDRQTLKTLLQEIGYANARVGVKQGVSPEGEDLIITFVIDDGIPTEITKVEIEGNTAFTDQELLEDAPALVDTQFSRAKIRNAQRAIQKFYADRGYFDANVGVGLTYIPADAGETKDTAFVSFNVVREGRQVKINRVLVNGNERTRREAILNAIDLRPDRLLRQNDIFTSEQTLYATDAFEDVEVKVEPAGETADGKFRQTDLIVNVREKKPRLLTYGGGFSTDLGWSGFFDIRHYNLFGRLAQGGAQVRWSQRQQLVQVDLLNPRFMKDGKDEDGHQLFAPLTFSAQYQRDSTVTRFFRSTFDEGTFGIVQRVDEDGNPIDEFGTVVADPTINRFTISAETSKTISRKNRTIVFFKYRFENVRLQNIDSLLLEDLLRPDSKIRISGFSVTLVRDTRENCLIETSLLEVIQNGEPSDPCKYSSSNPTDGDYLTAQYDTSLPFLGASIGFNKLQVSYNRYATFKRLRNTTFAGRIILGLANVFSSTDRFSSPEYEPLTGSLPISERFFAGGSTTIRGFEYDQAGPRVVIDPEGEFRDQAGDVVTLNPFAVPFGGNAMVVANLEARIPVTETVKLVPFYDGGNVYLGVKDIFRPRPVTPGSDFESDLRVEWSHTFGLGLRVETPFGGEFAVDYGYLLNPPSFIIPEDTPPDSVLTLHQGQFHFRFSQAF